MKFNSAKFRNDLDAMMKETCPDGYRFAFATENLAYLFGDNATYDERILIREMRNSRLRFGSNSGFGHGSGGFSRTAIDAPEMPASINDRFNIASMSKTITAAAVLNALQDKDLPVTTLVKDFFPSDWPLHPTIQTLTFQDFLTHKTGFGKVQNDHNYVTIKESMEIGPENPPKAAFFYWNINFAVFRIILPILNSYNRFTKKSSFIVDSNANPEEVYANEYVRIVNERVLIPSGIVNANCNSRRLRAPVLLYDYQHAPDKNGLDGMSNETLWSGAQGWAISVVDYTKFIQTLLFTEIIVSDTTKNLMLPTLGYPDPGFGLFKNIDPIDGSESYSHGGLIPYTEKTFISSWWFCFKRNNLIVTALANVGHKPHPHPNWADSCMRIYRESWSL